MRDIPADWLEPPDLATATAVQRELAGRVVEADDFGPVRRIGGADISHNPRSGDDIVHAALVALSAADLTPRAEAGATLPARFPYVPGFLGFREVPALVAAWQDLAEPPDLVFVDGHGRSHPRGLGIACQLGVVLDVPTIGVAKSILVGRPEGELGPEPGDRVPLVWRGRTVAMALRTKRRSNPLFISTGHRIALETAVDWVLRCLRGYRLPEPTRQAHLAANRLRLGADAPPSDATLPDAPQLL
ncbi:MAG TPA: deoxyribonuclease V [Alphaproteobacteria bacterium]|nr:deoxyribonuclease V [Alphaproteobacteria bacterium]